MREISSDHQFITANQKFLTYLPVLLVAICLLGVGFYADRLNTHASTQELKHAVLSQVAVIRARLEGNISNNVQLVKGLVAAISVEPDMTKERFIALSSPLISNQSQLRNIAAAPNLIIHYMNPVEGNEAAIGLDYRAIPEQFETVKLARDTGELILAGPVNLVQGGQGFIVRVPVFIASDNKRSRIFWGIISSVIDVNKFFTASGLNSTINDLEIAIRKHGVTTKQRELVYGDNKLFELDPVLSDITLPYGNWQLAALPKGGWSDNIESPVIFRVALLTIGIVILLPLFLLSRFMWKNRQSEERLHLLFKLSPVGIALNNYDTGDFIEVNNAFIEPTGYTVDEFKKLSYWDITPEKYKNDEAIQLENLEKLGQYGPYEKEYIRKDGHHYPVLLNGILIQEPSGKKMIWSFVEDISKRKQAEKSLQRTQKMDAIGKLTGGIAHDFNNILAVILGNLDLLKTELKTGADKAGNRIDSIYKAGLRAADLTKQLLSFSRIKPAKQDITNINNIVLSMYNLISRSVTPEVELSQQLADDLWLTKIDQGELEDALLNLSLNARDAMSGKGQLIIKTRNLILDSSFCEYITDAKPGEYIELSVSDNGEGISAELQERIFEPFYTTKDTGKGTGLGLPMVYGFVQRSGGFIKINSDVGVGTTINLYLPRYTGIDRPPTEPQSHNDKILPKGTETLLVVDDEEALLNLANELLQGMGYKVFTAIDGNQALKILNQQPEIDLLFTDVVMPGGINGYELAKQAIEKCPDLKVLLTSGYTGEVSQSTVSKQINFDTSLLNKPYSVSELAIRVRAMFDDDI